MASGGQIDVVALIFPITDPPPKSWADVSLVHGRCSRHWGLLRGLIEDQKKARKNYSSSARQNATLCREIATRLSLSLEAVDTKDKYNCIPGVGDAMHKIGGKHLVAQVTARNPKHQPSTKTFVGSAAAILVAMSREVKRRATPVADVTAAEHEAAPPTPWLAGNEIRDLAAPLCEEDLSHKGDEIVLGEVENFAWCSMAHLMSDTKFDCVKKKVLDEKATIAQLEKLGRRPTCSSPGCDAYATKSVGELSDRVRLDTFRRSLYCKEHYGEFRGVGKRKKAAGKGKGKTNSNAACDPVVLDDLDLSPPLVGGMGYSHHTSSSPSKSAATSATSGTGKIKADWYRRLLGEALLSAELDRVERWKGPDVAGGLHSPWRKDFAKNATNVYALTANGQWVADKLEKAVVASAGGARQATSTTTASPILNRSSYASCSERDGGGGGGTAASRHSGHSPLAPTRANGAAKPGVRLLIDNREKRGTTRNSQISELTSFLNSRGVPYEVRGWKVGDYGWVVQPDAGNRPSAGEVGYEREFVVPRLLERKRVDDLAESMKDGRLVRQKKAMLHAKDEGVVSEIEIHVEGGVEDRRYTDDIYRRGLNPEDLKRALRQSAEHGFKVVHHGNFADFSAYLADATLALQRQFDAKTLEFENFFTWQNFVRFSKGEIPLTPRGAAAAAAAEKAAAAAKVARGGRRGRPPAAAAGGGGRGRPPLPPGSAAAAVGAGLRQRTLAEAFGVTAKSRDVGAGSCPGGGRGGAETFTACAGGMINDGVQEEEEGGDGSRSSRGGCFSKETKTGKGSPAVVLSIDDGDDDDDDDDEDCSVVEVARPGAGSGSGSAAAAIISSTFRGGGGGGGGGGSSGGSGSGNRGKRKAAAEAGTSPFTIAASGGYSPAAAAAPRSRRASPATWSRSNSGPATASSPGLLSRDGGSSSPLPTTVGRRDGERGGAQSGCGGRSPSIGSKRPRPADDCGGGIEGGGGDAGNGGGGRARTSTTTTTTKKARSLSFGDEDDDEQEDKNDSSRGKVRAGRNSGDGSGASTTLQRRGHGSSGGGTGSGSSTGSSGGGSGTLLRPDVPLPAASRSADAGDVVVDLSLDSPSPLPRSRPRIAVESSPPQQQSPRQRTESGGGRRTSGGGGAGADDVVLEACSSDDDYDFTI